MATPAAQDRMTSRQTPVDPARVFKALAFAADKHRDQRRKDAEASPYINHPIAVATVLAGEGGIMDDSFVRSRATWGHLT